MKHLTPTISSLNHAALFLAVCTCAFGLGATAKALPLAAETPPPPTQTGLHGTATAVAPLSTTRAVQAAMAAPTIDAMERQTIQVYQQAAPAVVTLWAGNGTGAGVLLHPSGLLVTNQHVIGNPKRIQIKLYTGQRLHGKLLATSAGQGDDLALVQIIDVPAGTVFPTLPLLPDAEVPVVGQRVLAIGNPFGLEQTLSQGILSRIDHHKNRLQTDAAINPGNSGGPLLNLRGQLLGVNAAIYNPLGRNNTGIAFAVPVATIRKFLTQQRIAH